MYLCFSFERSCYLVSSRYGGCYSLINLKSRFGVEYSRAVGESSKSFYKIELVKMILDERLFECIVLLWFYENQLKQ